MIRVLLVDDDETVRKTLARYLKLKSFEVRSAGDSKEAFEIIEGFVPEALVVDWMLGDSVNGDELASLLRKRFPGLPAVIISGYPDADVAETEAGSSATKVLAKPFQPAKLVEALEDLVGPARAKA